MKGVTTHWSRILLPADLSGQLLDVGDYLVGRRGHHLAGR